MIAVMNEQAVAAALGCSIRTVQDRARSGELPGLKFGDEGWVFPIQALNAALNEQAIEKAAERAAKGEPPKATVVEAKSKKGPPALPSL